MASSSKAGRPPYRESLLQWIWQQRHFDPRRLASGRGERILVYHPGRLNRSDGPDFLEARIGIGQLTWYGDVEVHWRASDWRAHRHHTNPGYNRVILHVIYRDRLRPPTRRADGTRVPQLYLRPHLAAPLWRFLEASARPGGLPCGGLIPSLPLEVFGGQLDRSHARYFERKVRDALRWFPAGLPLSEAWGRMLGKAFFDGLGIAHNRAPMRELFDRVVSGEVAPARVLAGGLPELAGPEGRPRWKHKGCRPNNHPGVRVRQAARGWRFLRQLSPEEIRRENPAGIWERLLASMPPDAPLGAERSSILFATVLLPSLYLLGEFLADSALKRRSRRAWDRHRADIPPALLEPFAAAGLPGEAFRHKLGAVYQLRHYCEERRCGECGVFKHAIHP